MMEELGGIYRIICDKNSKYYYESTINFEKRFYDYLFKLKNSYGLDKSIEIVENLIENNHKISKN